ncbi:MAG: uracil-DNA glycosylase family protein [Anaerolineae bacterium]|nr:uracil-DNA glycosylase family protein [Anaerolineae bacterium]
MLNKTNSLNQLHTEMRACRLCYDAGHAIVPGAIFRGSAGARVMLIGQAPGVTEVEAKRPFNATSGTRLFQWLTQAGWAEDEFRDTQYMTAVTKCYPGKDKSGKGDRVPSKAEQALCRPFLEREMAAVKPRLIILVGGLAIKLMYPKSAKLRDIIGTAAYFPPETVVNPVNFDLEQAELVSGFDERKDENGRWVVPLPHPSGASLWTNKLENRALIDKAVSILSYLRTAYAL